MDRAVQHGSRARRPDTRRCYQYSILYDRYIPIETQKAAETYVKNSLSYVSYYNYTNAKQRRTETGLRFLPPFWRAIGAADRIVERLRAASTSGRFVYMPAIHLALFGTLQVRTTESSIALGSSSMSALLGYLALHGSSGRVVPRSTLAGKLWPGLTSDHARQMLNQTLYRLRRALGDGAAWLRADGATIGLVDVDIDVDAFKRYAASADLADWQAAIELYAGDLAEDLDAEWLLVPRITLRELFLSTLARLCTTLIALGRTADALAYARRWALADAFNEDAHRLIMQLFVRLGRHMAALQQYDDLVKLLDEEFQSAPLAQTRALATAIRAEYHPAAQALQRPVIVGRQAERTELLRFVEDAQQGRGRLETISKRLGRGIIHIAWLCKGVIWHPAPDLDAATGSTHHLHSATADLANHTAPTADVYAAAETCSDDRTDLAAAAAADSASQAAFLDANAGPNQYAADARPLPCLPAALYS